MYVGGGWGRLWMNRGVCLSRQVAIYNHPSRHICV